MSRTLRVDVAVVECDPSEPNEATVARAFPVCGDRRRAAIRNRRSVWLAKELSLICVAILLALLPEEAGAQAPAIGPLAFILDGDVLWRSDGTEEGAVLLRESIELGFEPVAIGRVPLFVADDDKDIAGSESWRTDGDVDGTPRVRDIRPGPSGSSAIRLQPVRGPPAPPIDVNRTLFFRAGDGIHDGTEETTILVKDIRTGAEGSDPALLTNLDGTLYFRAYDDGIQGGELWQSDVTDADTILVADISPGRFSSDPELLTNVVEMLYFRADDGTHGQELWQSDGTVPATQLVADDVPGEESPNNRVVFTASGPQIYFSADAPPASRRCCPPRCEPEDFEIRAITQNLSRSRAALHRRLRSRGVRPDPRADHARRYRPASAGTGSLLDRRRQRRRGITIAELVTAVDRALEGCS